MLPIFPTGEFDCTRCSLLEWFLADDENGKLKFSEHFRYNNALYAYTLMRTGDVIVFPLYKLVARNRGSEVKFKIFFNAGDIVCMNY